MNTTVDTAAFPVESRARIRPVGVLKPLDDRWPDHFAAAMFAFAAWSTVVAVVPPWRDYFAREQDIVSLLTIPIVPSLVYAALLVAMGVALRRRLRAAWWILVIWWLVLPELGQDRGRCRRRIVGSSVIGFVLIVRSAGHRVACPAAVRGQRVPGSLWQAIGVFLVGGAAVLLGGAALVRRFGDAQRLRRRGAVRPGRDARRHRRARAPTRR